MRIRQLGAVCRVLLTAAVALGASTFASSVASAEPGDSLADLERRASDAKNEANSAANRFTDAQSRYEQLGDAIAAIEQRIQRGEERAAGLREVAQRRAVAAYKSQGADISVIFESNDPREGARSSVLLQAANASDSYAVTEYAQIAGDLAAQRERLSSERKQQRDVLDNLAMERKLLAAKVSDAQRAQRDFNAKKQAAADAAPKTGVTAVQAPVVEGLMCPVPGAAFSNDWGQPRSGGRRHEGNDLFAPMGTSNIAVIGGNVTYGNAGLGGNGAYLEGDNGITYYYFHLSEFVGAPRHVNQGEVIGRLGDTGNARGTPHTHFEVHPGGRQAPAVNPFPAISKVC